MVQKLRSLREAYGVVAGSQIEIGLDHFARQLDLLVGMHEVSVFDVIDGRRADPEGFYVSTRDGFLEFFLKRAQTEEKAAAVT